VIRSLICSTVLGAHPEIKRLTAIPLLVFGVEWGVSSKPPARGRGYGPDTAAHLFLKHFFFFCYYMTSLSILEIYPLSDE
jgi:hypothetical protein